jgi:hypothetical protein
LKSFSSSSTHRDLYRIFLYFVVWREREILCKKTLIVSFVMQLYTNRREIQWIKSWKTL